MKRQTIITDITQDDLVNLMETAREGSSFFDIAYINRDEYLKHKQEGDYYTYVCGKMLLNGLKVEFRDYYAEDNEDFYGSLPHHYNEEDDCMVYEVSLDDIAKGIATALDTGGWVAKCANNLIEEDSYDLDLTQAETLVQVIMFGELIYG